MTDEIETTTDAFLGGALMLRQPKRGYRAGIDPVLLAARCATRAGERVLDCGAGVGTVGLCVARRVSGVDVVLIEREDVYAQLAAENIIANQLSDRVRLLHADLTTPQTVAIRALAGTFDHALANPPYYIDTDGTRSTDAAKDAANMMPADDLDAWARFLAGMLKSGGTATLIHRADALGRILAVFDRRFGAITVTPLQASTTSTAGRVLVSGIKGSRAPLSLQPAIVLHRADGGYTQEIEAVLRTPVALTRS
jgi:tRNA1(Val) A37 N6-methylase TrmN6